MANASWMPTWVSPRYIVIDEENGECKTGDSSSNAAVRTKELLHELRDLRWAPAWCSSRKCRILTLAFVTPVLLLAIAHLIFNAFVSHLIATSCRHLLGVKTVVNHVDMGFLSSRSELYGLSIANPEGIAGNFLDVDEAVLDIYAPSWWSSSESSPVEIQDLSLHGVRLTIVQTPDLNSNWVMLEDHVRKVLPRHMLSKELDMLEHMKMKIVADKVEFGDITVTWVTPLLNQVPVHIQGIKFTDVGKKRNGIHILDFVGIVSNAMMNAAMAAGPSNVGAANFDSTRDGGNAMLDDYSGLQLDAGAGFVNLGQQTQKAGDALANSISHTFQGPFSKLGGEAAALVSNSTGWLGNTLKKLGGHS